MRLCGSRVIVAFAVLKQREEARIALGKERARTEIIMSELPSSAPVWRNSLSPCRVNTRFINSPRCVALRAAAPPRFYKRENINVSFPPTASAWRHESDDNF